MKGEMSVEGGYCLRGMSEYAHNEGCEAAQQSDRRGKDCDEQDYNPPRSLSVITLPAKETGSRGVPGCTEDRIREDSAEKRCP